MKELEQENARLKKLVADLSVDNAILKEVVEGKLRDYLASAGVTTLFIEPGSPWEIRVLRELQLQDAR